MTASSKSPLQDKKSPGQPPAKAAKNVSINSFIELHFMGDMVLPKCTQQEHFTKMHRFEQLFEYCANLEKNYRLFLYKIIAALIITSHAKKLNASDLKKHLFDVKNKLIQSILGDMVNRRKLSYVYLKSPNFLVLEYCPECTQKNEEADKALKAEKNGKSEVGEASEKKEKSDKSSVNTTDKKGRIFCKKCKVDWKFYDIICIQHFFDQGRANLFLGGDDLRKFPKKLLRKQGHLPDYKEEMIFGKNLHFTSQNMSYVHLNSVIALGERLLK